MEEDPWSLLYSTPSRGYQSTLKSPDDYCFDYEDIEEDDETEYPCPYCPGDFDLFELVCHIDKYHPLEANSGVCPVCATPIVQIDMVGHIITQHRNIMKSPHRLKFHKSESYAPFSSLRKELEDGHLRSLLAGSSDLFSSSKRAPDPLLSFIYNVPTTDRPATVQSDLSTVEILEEKISDNKVIEKTVHPSPLSDKDQMEKTKRCEFVRELLLSTMFDDNL